MFLCCIVDLTLRLPQLKTERGFQLSARTSDTEVYLCCLGDSDYFSVGTVTVTCVSWQIHIHPASCILHPALVCIYLTWHHRLMTVLYYAYCFSPTQVVWLSVPKTSVCITTQCASFCPFVRYKQYYLAGWQGYFAVSILFTHDWWQALLIKLS